MREAKKKIFRIAVVLLAVAMLATPLVSAFPWTHPKNNEKFQSYEVVGTFSFLYILFGDHQYIPSLEEVNKLIITFTEPLDTMEITVDGNTYELGTDFLYTECLSVLTYFDPVFDEPNLGLLFPSEARGNSIRVYWTYDFSAIPGGIDGTLRMQVVSNNDKGFSVSLAGTGDLRNVRINAAGSNSFTPPLTINILHVGIVSGWPDIPPAP